MKKPVLTAATALLLSAFLLTSAPAAEACYTTRELEAEQGLRIHSELMVIGLTCAKMPGGQNLYAKYQKFTVRNSSLIAGYESDLISYYTHKGASRPEEKLHTLRTDLANEISRNAIAMGTASFCQRFSSHIDRALTMDQEKLRRWARHITPGQSVSTPTCARITRR